MDPLDPKPVLSPVKQKKTKRELTDKEKQQIVSRLLFEMQHSGIDGKFVRGTLTVVAGEFHVTRRTSNRILARAQAFFQNPDIRQFRASPQKKKKCGRPKKWNHDEICEAVTLISLFKRSVIRDLVDHALGVPKSCF